MDYAPGNGSRLHALRLMFKEKIHGQASTLCFNIYLHLPSRQKYATRPLLHIQDDYLYNILAPNSRLEDPRRQELVDLLCIVPNVRFQRKVTRVDKLQHKVLHITSECLGAGLDEDVVIRAPKSEYWHAARAEVLLPLRIELRIRAVVVEQGQLSLRGALACEQGRVERVGLRRDAGLKCLRHAVRVLPLCRA